jgi:hypothetical protein
LSSEPEGNVEIVVRRRRRTRRHRRNLFIRRVLTLVVLGCFAAASAFVVLQHLTPSLFHVSRSVPTDRRASEISRSDFVRTQEESLLQMENRPVYPYSIVPGGVKDARELKWAADHDPVVRAHYAGFDYDHARVVRLVLARTAYVSYRIGNRVYWTRHRITLKKGETVITDGKITARGRCGNRVEEMPQQATSSSEPPAAKFEQPMPVTGTAMSTPPVPFESALNNRPGFPGLGPAPPLSLYDPLGGGPVTPIDPPQLPGVCGPGKKKNGAPITKNKKGTTQPCGGSGGGGGGEVPEPSTWLLVGSGLALTYWMHRRRFAKI